MKVGIFLKLDRFVYAALEDISELRNPAHSQFITLDVLKSSTVGPPGVIIDICHF